jgi:hypothetical protein
MIRHLIPVLALAASASLAGAADRDSAMEGRLGIGIAPGVDKHDFSGPVSGTSDVDNNSGLIIEPGLFWSMKALMDQQAIGGVYGVNLFYRQSSGDNSSGGGQTKFDAFGAKIALGPTYKWEHIRFELTPFFGLGWARAKVDSPVGEQTSDRGLMIDYGITLNGFYDFTEQVGAGIEVGWDGFRAKEKFKDFPGGQVDDTVKGNGLLLEVVGTWKF